MPRAGTKSLVASTAWDDVVATPRRRRRGHERGAAVAAAVALAVTPPRSRGAAPRDAAAAREGSRVPKTPPPGSDGNYQSFAPFQIPIEYDYDVLDLKHIIQAQLGYEPDEINLRVAGDFRPDESKLGPIFGRWFKEGWHMQASVYPKGWKSALEKYQDENGKN